MEIEMIPISEIIPYSKNPRKNDKAVDIVVKSIKEFGFRNPILLDKNNEIIAGHTRIKAAEKLGLKEVPVIWIEDLTPEQIKAYRIMDNRSSEFAEWDIDLLKEEINELKNENYNTDLTGFSDFELNNLIKDYNDKNKELDIDNLTSGLNTKCPKCGFEFKNGNF